VPVFPLSPDGDHAGCSITNITSFAAMSGKDGPRALARREAEGRVL
jgi:hypothetical protein